MVRVRGVFTSVRVLAVLVAMAVVVSLAGVSPAVAAPKVVPGSRVVPAPAADRGASVHDVVSVPVRAQTPVDHVGGAYQARAVTWPGAASETLALPSSAPSPGLRMTAMDVITSLAPTRGSATPVWLQRAGAESPARATVQVFDHAQAASAGVSGVLFTVAGADGTGAGGAVRVGLDYSGFAQAYGGNYGARLRLVRLPACVLSTPQLTQCRAGTPLATSNNLDAQSVSAQVALDATATATADRAGSVAKKASLSPSAAVSGLVVLAATSDPGQEGSPGGSYAATSLKPSGSWTAGGSTGSFDFTYPIEVPPAASSLAPQVQLAYDSGSVDGQTVSTQAQSSWVGDGWSTPDSFIEQSFVSCSDEPEGSAAPVNTGDQCYNGPILTLSLNGQSTPLVWDAGKSVWKAQSDSGAVITHVPNSNNGTGAYNSDYWQVTERDGTTYLFGRNQIPGWSSGKATTNSVNTMPVYSAHSGDPCYNSSFSSSWCTMAYRWNLDYVKDVHDNAMSYWYKQDTNYYGRYNGANNTAYVRDSHLNHIDYGFTDGNAYGTPANKVVFDTGDRCLSGTCQPLSASTKANWPDVPFDLVCTSGATCSSTSPSFFSTVRLAGLRTQQYSVSSYVDVDLYALAQMFPSDTGDGLSPTLWLQSITRTGKDTTAGGSGTITLPPVKFTATLPMANRVDTASDGLAPLDRFRIQTVTTESGSVITLTYGQPNPCTAPVNISPSSNISSCYPVSWTPAGYTQPYLDWFNKYVVTRVTQSDLANGGPAIVNDYEYPGGAAWHYDDNEVVKAKYRTYGQFRGYGQVNTYAGDGVTDRHAMSQTTYYRGMSKNNNSTVVNVTDSAGGTHEDRNELSGRTLEETAYLGQGGPVDHSTITSYWVSDPTATRSRTGLAALTATTVAPVETYTRQAVTGSEATTWRQAETDTSYVSDVSSSLFGLQTSTYTHTVPADPAFDRCTSMSYAPVKADLNLVGLVEETETDAVACGGFTQGSPASVPGSVNTLTAPSSVNRPSQVVSAERTFYDDPSFSTTWQQAAPTKGDVTMTRKAADYTGGAFVWQTTGRSVYDALGRVTKSYDAAGHATTTSYTDTTAGVTTAITTSNPLSQTSSTTLDGLRGLTLTATDANGVKTTSTYDALGRRTAVWLASRDPATTSANYLYTYQLRNDAETAVTTKKMNESGGYLTSTLIYDALLRTRQTQTDTPQSGRLVTDTFYDSRGWVSAQNNRWWDPATTPSTTLASAADLHAQVPNADVFAYDGLGRQIRDDSQKNGVTLPGWSTITVYNGDRTTTLRPTGGISDTVVVDVLGRTIRRDQYTTAPTLNTPSDQFTGVWFTTGGNVSSTSYGYDARGNQNTVTDAANTTWTTAFDLLGRGTARTSPDAGTSTYGYDPDGNLLQSTDARGKTVSYTYDALDRRTGHYTGPVSTQSASNLLASWVYDNSDNAVSGMKYPIGHVTSDTSYYNGAAYKLQEKNFDVFGNSLGQTITIPTGEGLLGGSYTFQHTYTTNTGLALRDMYQAAGGLPSETVIHGYDAQTDLPEGLTGLSGYAYTTLYDAYGRVAQETIGSTSAGQADITNTWDAHTSRLSDQVITRGTSGTNIDQQHYDRDPAGNITRQTSTRASASTPTETQCYSYDHLAHLTAAWTATDACAITPTATNHSMVGDSLGASSAYWTTWSINPAGQRAQQVQHAVSGGSDTTTTYMYNGNSAGQPHTLTGTSSTGGTTTSTSYGYDAAGNMTARAGAQGNQTLTWDDAGRLGSITTPGAGTTTYKYGANGNLLVQADPTSTILYLPNQQLTLKNSAVTGVRYYDLPGSGRVVRTGTGTNYSFEITDGNNTPVLYLDRTAQTATWRQHTPYGADRGTTTAWPDNRGFLNQPTNATTGLDEVGARNYDPVIGIFISIDSVFNADDPQQLNGYSYANNSPVTLSDPTGLSATSYNPNDCPTSECYQAESQARDNIQARIQAQQQAAVDAANACPNQACYDQHIAEARVDYIDMGSYGLSVDGNGSVVNTQWWKPSLRRGHVYVTGPSFADHIQVSVSGCLVICLGVSYQAGVVSFSTGPGAVGGGASVMYNSLMPSEQGFYSLTGCALVVVGPCGGIENAVDADGGPDGVGLMGGLGFGMGSTVSESYGVASYDTTTGQWSFPVPSTSVKSRVIGAAHPAKTAPSRAAKGPQRHHRPTSMGRANGSALAMMSV
jgi:RHS repeat-associated protein